MSETPPICVTHTFEFADYAAFYAISSRSAGFKHHNRRLQSIWLLALASAAPILTIVDMVVMAEGRLLAIGLAGAVLLWVMAAMFGALFRKAHLRSYFFLHYNANQTMTDCLSDDGVSSDCGKVHSFYAWSSIIRQEATADHLVLSISPLQGIVLPRRAFASTEDFSAAVAFVKERVARP